MPPSKKKPDADDELCGCDADFRMGDPADDEALPAATGGVAVDGVGEEADGCDAFFGGGETTSDEELPATTGGVE